MKLAEYIEIVTGSGSLQGRNLMLKECNSRDKQLYSALLEHNAGLAANTTFEYNAFDITTKTAA